MVGTVPPLPAMKVDILRKDGKIAKFGKDFIE